jgi:hypothetical protein
MCVVALFRDGRHEGKQRETLFERRLNRQDRQLNRLSYNSLEDLSDSRTCLIASATEFRGQVVIGEHWRARILRQSLRRSRINGVPRHWVRASYKRALYSQPTRDALMQRRRLVKAGPRNLKFLPRMGPVFVTLLSTTDRALPRTPTAG